MGFEKGLAIRFVNAGNTPADVRQTANPKVLHRSMSPRGQVDDEST